MFHSISWRLQISYGLLLIGAFIALGIAAYHLEHSSRMSAVDAGLQSRATQLTGALFRLGTPLPEPVGGEPGELPLPRHDLIFGQEGEFPYYYIIWENNTKSRPLFRSKSAPVDIEIPSLGVTQPEDGLPRIRDGSREQIYRTRRGFMVLVGRDISRELASIRSQSLKFAFTGGLVLLAGLFVSYWLAKRALKPIADISEAATRIAKGALDERIETAGNQSELGQLGEVLNHTFDELENAYRRQSRFTADASHELRTPVTVILTEIQSAPKGSRSPEEYEECLSVCEEAATSMQSLLQQLMALAQFDAGKGLLTQQSVALHELVDRCIAQIKPLAEAKRISISQTINEVSCSCDPDRLSQVVTNLLSNAIAYNGEGSSVSVSLRAGEKQAVLEVTDNGPGIAPEDAKHLFERFYRADKSRSSAGDHSGLGLAICREIAEAHGGEIGVESTLDKGSAFTLRIPI